MSDRKRLEARQIRVRELLEQAEGVDDPTPLASARLAALRASEARVRAEIAELDGEDEADQWAVMAAGSESHCERALLDAGIEVGAREDAGEGWLDDVLAALGCEV